MLWDYREGPVHFPWRRQGGSGEGGEGKGLWSKFLKADVSMEEVLQMEGM